MLAGPVVVAVAWADATLAAWPALLTSTPTLCPAGSGSTCGPQPYTVAAAIACYCVAAALVTAQAALLAAVSAGLAQHNKQLQQQQKAQQAVDYDGDGDAASVAGDPRGRGGSYLPPSGTSTTGTLAAPLLAADMLTTTSAGAGAPHYTHVKGSIQTA
jgi:hypothetical protein